MKKITTKYSQSNIWNAWFLHFNSILVRHCRVENWDYNEGLNEKEEAAFKEIVLYFYMISVVKL